MLFASVTLAASDQHAHWSAPISPKDTPRLITVKENASPLWDKSTTRAIKLWNNALKDAQVPLRFLVNNDSSNDVANIVTLTKNDFPQNSGTQLEYPTSTYEISAAYVVFNDVLFRQAVKGWSRAKKQKYLRVSACEAFGWALGLQSRSLQSHSCMNAQKIDSDRPDAKDVQILNHMYDKYRSH